MLSRGPIILAFALLAAIAVPGEASAATGSIYFTAGEQFKAVKRSLPDSGPKLPAALRLLVKGPSASEVKRDLGSAIPDGSRLIKSEFDEDTGLARIRFNAKFAETNEQIKTEADVRRVYFARAGQVVFTATSLAGVKSVRLSVPGEKSYTLDRSDFKKPSSTPGDVAKPPKVKGPKPGDTRGLQTALAALKFLPTAAITGKYDDRTRQAVYAFQAYAGLGRDGIAGPATSAAFATAKIPTPLHGGSGRHIEIDRAKGLVYLVSGTKLVRAIHTSTGLGGDSTDLGTPPGRFKIYRKEKNSWSVPYQVWLPYAAYWNAGWALHGYASVPAYPASHGCARLPLAEAPVVYNFVKIGTRVYIK
ncbi:MAG: L,D-transpeptidase family protein [Solirubrobacterales bacterium]